MRSTVFPIVGDVLLITCTQKGVGRQSSNMVYKRFGKEPWMHTPAGGAEELVSKPDDIKGHKIIRLHYDKHNARTFVLVVHTDCAAYSHKPWEAMKKSEQEYLKDELAVARSNVLAAYPDVVVHCFLAVYDPGKEKVKKYITVT